jgi:hypothetical protein
VKAVGILLSLSFAVVGFVVALGAWGVGYCGGLTSDSAQPGTLRHDLCRGTSGNLMGAVVFASWVWAAVAPALGTYVALRRNSAAPLAWFTVLGAIPIATIAVLAAALPQG